MINDATLRVKLCRKTAIPRAQSHDKDKRDPNFNKSSINVPDNWRTKST